jgi:hypothetical protein
VTPPSSSWSWTCTGWQVRLITCSGDSSLTMITGAFWLRVPCDSISGAGRQACKGGVVRLQPTL